MGPCEVARPKPMRAIWLIRSFRSRSFDLQTWEKAPRVLFEDVGFVRGGEKLNGGEQRLNIVETLASLLIIRRPRSRILRAEQNAFTAHHSNQHLERLFGMEARIVIEHLHTPVELVNRAA